MTQTDPTAVLARIRQMADYWEQHLPEVIRTPAVVSALRAALEGAPAVVPPTDRAVAYRSPGTRRLYCVICARQETGWRPVMAADVQDDTACDFCGGRVLAIASQTLGEVVARYADAGRAAVLLDAADVLPDADLPFVSPMGRRQTADWLRRRAAEAAASAAQPAV